MPKWIHKLTEKDLVNQTAICSFCGPVKIKIKNSPCRKGKPWCRCRNAVKANQRGVSSNTLEKPEKCPLCLRKKKLVLDHKHGEKIMRGWICSSCNLIIGLSLENKDILQRIINYI